MIRSCHAISAIRFPLVSCLRNSSNRVFFLSLEKTETWRCLLKKRRFESGESGMRQFSLLFLNALKKTFPRCNAQGDLSLFGLFSMGLSVQTITSWGRLMRVVFVWDNIILWVLSKLLLLISYVFPGRKWSPNTDHKGTHENVAKINDVQTSHWVMSLSPFRTQRDNKKTLSISYCN